MPNILKAMEITWKKKVSQILSTKVFGHKNHGLYYQRHHCSRRRKLKKEKLCKKRKIVHKKGSSTLMKYKSVERDQEDPSQSMVNYNEDWQESIIYLWGKMTKGLSQL